MTERRIRPGASCVPPSLPAHKSEALAACRHMGANHSDLSVLQEVAISYRSSRVAPDHACHHLLYPFRANAPGGIPSTGPLTYKPHGSGAECLQWRRRGWCGTWRAIRRWRSTSWAATWSSSSSRACRGQTSPTRSPSLVRPPLTARQLPSNDPSAA